MFINCEKFWPGKTHFYQFLNNLNPVLRSAGGEWMVPSPSQGRIKTLGGPGANFLGGPFARLAGRADAGLLLIDSTLRTMFLYGGNNSYRRLARILQRGKRG